MADVYKGKLQPEKKPVFFFLYLAFFPDVVSGPINRAEVLIPQLKEEKAFDYDRAVYGMRLILLGLFKKLLIADTLSRYVNPVFETPGAYMGIKFTVIFRDILIWRWESQGCSASAPWKISKVLICPPI